MKPGGATATLATAASRLDEVGEALGDLEGLHPRGPREPQRNARCEVAVFALLRALDGRTCDLGGRQQPLRLRTRHPHQ